MRLLGFRIAVDKDKPFSVRSETLGVIVDTSDANLERVFVSNKPSRSQSTSQAMPRELPSLFGRLQFAEAQILGRMGRLALHDLRNLVRSPAAQVSLTSRHLEALMLLKDRVRCGAPRTVSATQTSKPIVVFTDGCFEPGSDVSAGVGGVMFCPTSIGSLQVKAFGVGVPSMLLDTWYSKGKRHLIDQVEMYAVLCARSCWADALDGSRVIFLSTKEAFSPRAYAARQRKTLGGSCCALLRGLTCTRLCNGSAECPLIQTFLMGRPEADGVSCSSPSLSAKSATQLFLLQ